MKKTTGLFLISIMFSALPAMASNHRVFVCQSENQSIGRGITMFAYDSRGSTGANSPDRPGFCELPTDGQGRAYGSYFCWIGDTRTATTRDGQAAILFKQNLGSGAYLITQINLPRNFVRAGGGAGRIRTLSRAPLDLSTPIANRGSEAIRCRLESVPFNQP